MAVVVLTSATGSPGTTTTALALALTWPRDVLLADCDREPSQAIQAGYLRGADHGGRGLVSLARLHREDRAISPDLWRHTVALSTADHPQRRFLPGFSVPAAVTLFDRVWPDLADAFANLDGSGVDVIVDAGSVGRTGLPLPLLARAELVCLVSRTSLRALAGTRLYLPVVTEQLERLPVTKPLGLFLVGPDRPYSSGEISAQFGLGCWAEVTWNERMAAILSDGEAEPRRFSSGPFLNQFRAIGLRLSERIAAGRELDRSLTARPAHV